MRKFSLATAMLSALVLSVSALAQDREPAPRHDLFGLELFAAETLTGKKLPPADTGVIRSRTVAINTALFSKAHPNHGDRTRPGSVIELNLFEDIYFTAILDRAIENNDGSTTWVGYLAEIEESSVHMNLMPDGVLVGNIVTTENWFQIRYVAGDIHMVRIVDQAALPADADPVVLPDFAAKQQDHDHSIRDADIQRADSGSVIDVMVVYTPNARSAAGGTSAIQSLINLAVSETNTGYTNSGVNTQLNLVYTEEMTQNSSGNFSTDLSRLAGTSDGWFDGVHAKRDQYCADMVALIVNATQYCGIAYLMSNASSSFESSAFSVTARTCATGYYSFGHELGHNMGCRHDWYVDSSTSQYIYNHGYTYPNANWRTIMAYNNACSAAGTSCTRLNYWSNPNVTRSGVPMGVSGTSVGSAAHNARAINNNLSVVANFRDSTSSSCGSTPPPPSGCTGDYVGSGSLSGTGQQQFHPNGTYWYSSTGDVSVTLEGPSNADFDLFLWKWNGNGWSVVASAETGSSNESINYNGTSGYYAIRVFSYSGSGSYDICASGAGL